MGNCDDGKCIGPNRTDYGWTPKRIGAEKQLLPILVFQTHKLKYLSFGDSTFGLSILL